MKRSSILIAIALIFGILFSFNVNASQTQVNQTCGISIPYGIAKSDIGYLKDTTSTGPQSFYVYNDALYFLDTVQKRIAVYSNGAYVKDINIDYTSYPFDIAITNDTIFVLDNLDDPTLYKISLNGVTENSEKIQIPTLYKAGQPYSMDSKYPVITGLNINKNNKIAVVTSDNFEYEINFNKSDYLNSSKGISSPLTNQSLYLEKQDLMSLKSTDNVINYDCTVNCLTGNAEIVGFDKNGNTYINVGDQANSSKVILESTIRKINKNGKLDSIALVPLDECADYPFKAFRVTPDGDVYFMALKTDKMELIKLSFATSYVSKIKEKEITQKALEATMKSNQISPASVSNSRTTTNDRAYAINNLQWYYMPYNANPPSGATTPDWLLTAPRYVYKYGIPYCWGGFDAIDRHSAGGSWSNFINAMNIEQFAGNVNCSGSWKSGTAGLDCSGYVGACLGYTWKPSTMNLWNNSTAVSGSPQWMNSYNNYSGHVLFVWYQIDSNNIATLESTTSNYDKCKAYQRTLNWLSTNGYSQRTFW